MLELSQHIAQLAEMKTFDDIAVRRPALAQSYLGMLNAQPGRPIALFAPRRVGKTFFLDHDLTPEAEKTGMLPVYADLWLHKTAPLGMQKKRLLCEGLNSGNHGLIHARH